VGWGGVRWGGAGRGSKTVFLVGGMFEDNYCHGLAKPQSVTIIILENGFRSGCGKGAARRVFRG